MSDLRLTWYGDDFTGSTDSLEALTLGGVRAALFLEPPQPDDLTGRFADLQAIGLAGVSRSLSPAEMEIELRPKFEALKQLGGTVCHYKTCSTFDSSPQVGSIGRATDIGCEVFQPNYVPLVVAAPALKRYVVFGNLFATVGADTYRLDRHPTMSKHPTTPMNESDLRLHLARQTDQPIALFDILHLAGKDAELDQHLEALRADNAKIIVFDTLDNVHLAKVGRMIWNSSQTDPLFVVGSSGVEYALVAHWQQIGLAEKRSRFQPLAEVDQLVVVSGSASPVTAGQIDWAIARGYAGLRLDTVKLVDPDQADSARTTVIEQALSYINKGKSVIVYTVHGPDDPALHATRQRMRALDLAANNMGEILGVQLGQILRVLLAESGLRRACVAGGDTSGFVAPQLGIYALEMIMPTAPGSPLCRASSHEPQFDGLEIVLKGGQVGQANYFGVIQQGGLQP